MDNVVKAVFERFDVWVISKTDIRKKVKSCKDLEELEKFIKSNKFKRDLKVSKSVEILKIYNKEN